MLTAIDSSVLLDVIIDVPGRAEAAEKSLRLASSEGGLVICECVVAEVRPTLSAKAFREFAEDWKLVFVASSWESASLAGDLFETYLKRGGRGGRVVVDFLIGAHALVHADRLLARDRGYFRDYFKGLKLLSP
ncbi:MAG: PIN domain-containing protein [Pseudolabrys sp.]